MSGGEGRRGKRLRDIKKKEEQFTTDILDMLIFDADHSCQQEKCELKSSKQFPEHLFSYDIYHPYRTSPVCMWPSVKGSQGDRGWRKTGGKDRTKAIKRGGNRGISSR